jgi:hypothetical protein
MKRGARSGFDQQLMAVNSLDPFDWRGCGAENSYGVRSHRVEKIGDCSSGLGGAVLLYDGLASFGPPSLASHKILKLLDYSPQWRRGPMMVILFL